MELVLTGSPTTATEMERFGVVNKVCSAEEDVLEESLKVARVVATFSAPAIGLAKQAVKAGKHPPLTHRGPCFRRFCELTARSRDDAVECGVGN